MQEYTQKIQAKEIELKKTVQSLWVALVFAGAFGIATIFFLLSTALRIWETILFTGLFCLIYVWRAIAIQKAMQVLREELLQLRRVS